ncbi:A/G-specific adenine glycosylase [Herbiconiux sp. L3-i23]|uniref:A/G-specific adenine glycosylase n=1 Tax=Herbiconiux sp. L3-i23 TaxID=2905871 RepID=UPI002073D457|nr:A/G-specific adenine glycosylase [Herbiconiux sp. L3-i23]
MTDAGELADLVVPWFARNSRDLPWRRPGFSAWGTLVSEFMLQQTPVARVVPRLLEWLERWPTPADLAAEAPGEAVRAWGRLGYPRRALALHACAVAIAHQHGNRVPDDVDQLLALPGVGAYTARAVASFAYGRRHPVVDTNVRRVLARAVAGQAEPGPPSTRRDLEAMAIHLPDELDDARSFNAGTMELGAIVCTARSPRCGECPLKEVCVWRLAGYPDYTGVRRAPQKQYEGSDRQARGAVLALLRESASPLAADAFAAAVTDGERRERILTGLIADGLVVRDPAGFRLP